MAENTTAERQPESGASTRRDPVERLVEEMSVWEHVEDALRPHLLGALRDAGLVLVDRELLSRTFRHPNIHLDADGDYPRIKLCLCDAHETIRDLLTGAEPGHDGADDAASVPGR